MKIIVHPRWRVSGTWPGQNRRSSVTEPHAAKAHFGVANIATGALSCVPARSAALSCCPADPPKQPETAIASKTATQLCLTFTSTRAATGQVRSLRSAGGWETLPEGEVVAFPRGEPAAHGYRNDGAEPVRLLMISEMSAPNISVHPDANQVGIFVAGQRAQR